MRQCAGTFYLDQEHAAAGKRDLHQIKTTVRIDPSW
jgi:hypothetical protein